MPDPLITTVRVRNFRSIKELDLNLVEFNSLLGKNDTGKSSFLRALQLLFDASQAPQPADICSILPIEEAFIEAVIDNVPAGAPYESDGSVSIRLDLITGARTAKGPTPSNPVIRAMKSGNCRKGDYQGDRGLTPAMRGIVDPIIAANPAPGNRVTPEGWRQGYAALNAAGLVEVEDGWDLMDSTDLSDLVVPVMLTADAKAEEELADAPNTALGRVGGFLLRQAVASHEGLRNAEETLKTQIAEVSSKGEDNRWAFEPLNDLEDLFIEEIHRFDESVIVTPKITPPKLRLAFGISLSVGDEFVASVSGLGHGCRRTVVFALLQIPRMLASRGALPEEPPQLPIYLFLIEEPELYLHPQAERQRMTDLEALADSAGAQVVLATHSAFFVDINRYRGLARFSRPERQITVVQQWDGDDLDADDKEKLKLARFLHPTYAAMLFADLVILSEGDTEKTVVPHIAKNQLALPNTTSAEFLQVGGVGNLHLFSKVLTALRIKHVVWLDSDRPANVTALRRNVNPAYGKIVVSKRDWEVMTGVSGGNDKPWSSFKKFVLDGAAPNDLTRRCIEAAYNWQDFDASRE